MLVFNDQVLSRANHQLAVLQDDISRTKPSFVLKEQIINTVVDQKLYLRAARIDRGTQHMKDVVIYDVSDPAHRRTIYADSGTLGVAENGTDLLMHLYDGSMIEVPTQQSDQLTRLFYKSDILRVQNVTNSFQATDADSASKSDREMTVCEMQSRFADSDLRYRQARYDRLEAEAQLAAAQGRQDIQWPAKPQPGNPFGLGRIYCAVVNRLFAVKTASAATLPAAQQQQPPQKAAPPRPLPPSQQSAAVIQKAESAATAGSAAAAANGQPILRSLPPGGQAPYNGLNELQLRSQVEGAIAREKIMRFMRIRYDIEIQKKFSLAAACLIFVLLGPPIALRFPRGGVGLVIGVSFSVFALYYVGLIGGETLADGEIISPFWAMWGANLIMFLVGAVMTLRMNRVSGATRGGDWTELRETARHVFQRLLGRAPRPAP
jgi:lipopolysaccharide export system permease protein